MSLRFLHELNNASTTPQPGSRWRPEEDEKLVRLLAWGSTWAAISNALPGRSQTSCMMHYRQTLAHRMRLGLNPVVQTYARHRARIWEDIGKELSVSADEAETMFLYLCRESPTMLQKNGTLPPIASQTNEEVAYRLARNTPQIKKEPLVMEDPGEEMLWEMQDQYVIWTSTACIKDWYDIRTITTTGPVLVRLGPVQARISPSFVPVRVPITDWYGIRTSTDWDPVPVPSATGTVVDSVPVRPGTSTAWSPYQYHLGPVRSRTSTGYGCRLRTSTIPDQYDLGTARIRTTYWCEPRPVRLETSTALDGGPVRAQPTDWYDTRTSTALDQYSYGPRTSTSSDWYVLAVRTSTRFGPVQSSAPCQARIAYRLAPRTSTASHYVLVRDLGQYDLGLVQETGDRPLTGSANAFSERA
ncbi:hypothetical protein F5B22DRAFT_657092 [Xylaria bambusicola]|uniref:uncharacterized protein n=1 Tax=Xylaria bambusicola TaxID=326684 RepID=UPI002007B59D|nr:uncharacterized protein F5B22DRAFT_657092 [Xylaria bambusicola]KAI0525832.1 hypothetical protein F5B22DRAFT_657092 [Xylaria bambusicola]